MNELDTLMQILTKLKEVEDLKAKVDNLEKEVQVLKEYNLSQMSKAIATNSINETEGIDAADWAIFSYKKKPIKK